MMHIRNTPGCLVRSTDYDKTRDFRIVALGRKYDTEIFLSPTKETCFLYLYTCYLDEDYVPRVVLYEGLNFSREILS